MNLNLLLSSCLVALLSLDTIQAAHSILDIEVEEALSNETDYRHIPGFAFDHEYIKSHNGSERLIISFKDGEPDDEVILTPTKGLIPNEDGDQSNDCIYSGYFKKESNVYIAVNGCRNSRNISVVFDSDRSYYKMFAVRNGVVTPFKTSKNNRKAIIEEAKHMVDDIGSDNVSLSAESRSITGKGYSLPATFKGDIYVVLDRSFRRQFPFKYTAEANKVINLSNALLKLKSLVTSFDFKVIGHKDILYNMPITFGGIQLAREEARVNIKDKSQVYMFLTQYTGSGAKGIAGGVGLVCSSQMYRVAITGHTGSEQSTAQILTHGIGHLLGMKNDHWSTGKLRACAKTTSTMMGRFGPNTRQWSTCSLKDFMNYYYPKKNSFCMSGEGSVSVCFDRSVMLNCKIAKDAGQCHTKPDYAELCRETCGICINEPPPERCPMVPNAGAYASLGGEDKPWIFR